MAEPTLGEIRIFSFGFAPRGYALCNGAAMSIQQNQALYSLLGLTYGGSGSNFNLPDLMGRVPIPAGANPGDPAYVVKPGDKPGAEAVSLVPSNLPLHNHTAIANAINADIATPVTSNTGFIWAMADDPNGNLVNAYMTTNTPDAPMYAGAVSATGSGATHANIQPYLTVNFCIAINGYYPVRP